MGYSGIQWCTVCVQCCIVVYSGVDLVLCTLVQLTGFCVHLYS